MKKLRYLVLGLVLLLLVLTGCNSQNPPATTAPTQEPLPTEPMTTAPSATPTSTEMVTPGTITIWHSWDESQMPVLVQIQHEFRTIHPDVHFDVLYIPIDDLFARFASEVNRGAGPTILLGPAQWGPALFEAGLLADLGKQGLEDLAASLNQPAVGASRYQSALIGLPYSMNGVVLYRNRMIHPTRVESFDKLVAQAQFATQGEQVGAVLERSFYYAGAHLDGIGGELMDEDGNPAFNNAKGLEWLQLLGAFEEAGPPNYMNHQDLEAFKEGRVGWIIDGTWNLEQFAEVLGADILTIDLWPVYGEGVLAGYVQAENIYLSSQAKGAHLEASLDFIDHFLSPESQTQLTDIGLIPTSSEVQIVNVTTGHLYNQAIAALAGGVTYPVKPEMEIYATQMEIALKSFYDGTPAEDVLQAAESTINELLSQFQVTSTPEMTPTP